MATIAITELRPVGHEFFSDSESFLGELSDSELNDINGGIFQLIIASAAYSSIQCGAAISAAATIVGTLIYKAVT
ncbi:MAG: class IIb bacteriocin, lactobin A/cerein 7B family [Goleter apudmare HA4340-LM2]|jgi:lactobin A/cerein 7B family class IIb bacteriocin|nr:class IIb bacteriocin, lactobin A/cerein 7B family [Goleter apudmare HA4340-LM2]